MDLNATLLGEMITFALFVWFTMTYVWPLIMKAIDDRQKQIADGLAAAKAGEKTLQHATDALHEAKNEAQRVLIQGEREAVRQAGLIQEEARQKAKEESTRIVLAARAEVAREQAQAKQVLRDHVADISLQGLEKMIGIKMDEAKNDKLLIDLLNELEEKLA